VVCLAAFADAEPGQPLYEITDPYGGDAGIYRATYARIESGVAGLIAVIAEAREGGSGSR
jgi:protein-tyrosine-phosphatase